GDQEHGSAGQARGRQNLDVQGDRPGNHTRAIEGNADRSTLKPVRRVRTGCQRDRRVRGAGRGQCDGEDKPQEETTTHGARQSTSARVRFNCPVSATELELTKCSEVSTSSCTAASGRPSPPGSASEASASVATASSCCCACRTASLRV